MIRQIDGKILIQHAWPQLGRALYSLECKMIDAGHSLDEQQKKKLREKLRAAIIAQCGTYEQQYEAYELVKEGRATEIVRNPHYLDRDGKECELPYTGLEGYYAGSEKRSGRPGMTAEQIVEEEANTGLDLLKAIKQRCVEDYSWSDFSKMKRALGEEEKADLADLRNLCLLWTEVVRRLRQRVYENEEAQGTPLEQIEALMSSDPKMAKERVLQEEHARLLEEEQKLNDEERAEARARKRAREHIFRSRLEEFTRFREETYRRLKDPCGSVHHIAYHIEDTSLANANIVETLTLPPPEDRSYTPPYQVHLTPEQLEGYLFLAHLGEKGGDPLIRGMLLSTENY